MMDDKESCCAPKYTAKINALKRIYEEYVFLNIGSGRYEVEYSIFKKSLDKLTTSILQTTASEMVVTCIAELKIKLVEDLPFYKQGESEK